MRSCGLMFTAEGAGWATWRWHRLDERVSFEMPALPGMIIVELADDDRVHGDESEPCMVYAKTIHTLRFESVPTWHIATRVIVPVTGPLVSHASQITWQLPWVHAGAADPATHALVFRPGERVAVRRPIGERDAHAVVHIFQTGELHVVDDPAPVDITR